MNSLQPLIIASAELLFIGMGTVFIILILLIFLITLVSKLLTRFNLVDPPQAPARRAVQAATTSAATTNNNELIAVISSAVKTYKKRHPLH